MIQAVLAVLMYVQAALVFVALPLSLIAAYGFWGTPWGRVLAPLPVMEVAFGVGLGVSLLDAGGVWLYVQVVAYGTGVVAIAAAAYHLARIATGGVRA
ncbi:MAG: hypothetical protein ABEH83_09115 [Halobacterium sp.]